MRSGIASSKFAQLKQLISDMKMPSLSDLRKTKEELELALAELDNLERVARSIDLAAENGAISKHEAERSTENNQLKEKVEFLEQSNKELAVKNDELVDKFKKVNSEKDSLKKDIDSLRDISQKLQVLNTLPCRPSLCLSYNIFRVMWGK